MTENLINTDSFGSSLYRYVEIIMIVMVISWRTERGSEKNKFVYDLIDKFYSQDDDPFGDISTRTVSYRRYS